MGDFLFTGRIWKTCIHPGAALSAARNTAIRCKRTKSRRRRPTFWIAAKSSFGPQANVPLRCRSRSSIVLRSFASGDARLIFTIAHDCCFLVDELPSSEKPHSLHRALSRHGLRDPLEVQAAHVAVCARKRRYTRVRTGVHTTREHLSLPVHTGWHRTTWYTD